MPTPAIAIHGGALNKKKGEIPPDMEALLHKGLKNALEQGWKILEAGGSAVDAVEAAVIALEDFETFNAGTGSALRRNGSIECDASIMSGADFNAGCASNIKRIKNPIRLARRIMDRSEHTYLTAEGAEEFAEKNGLFLIENKELVTDRRLKEWQDYRKEEKENRDSSDTVGAVALDMHGNLAAACSTGGIGYSLPGRIGDTPIIGSGIYADNAACASAFSGEGDLLIKGVYAKELSSLVKYKCLSLKGAADELLRINERTINAEMGFVAIDKEGNIELRMNCLPMYRGWKNSEGEATMIWE